MRAGRLDDLREADDGDQVGLVDRPAVDLFEEALGLLEPAELGVVVLDVASAELFQRLHLDVVDHRGEEFLARAVTEADRDPDELAALVLRAFIAEADRRRLTTAFQLVAEDRRVEVEDIDAAASHEPGSVYEGAARPLLSVAEVLRPSGGIEPSP